jgi:DNA-directed RNA polymerase specialized sigma subunit
MLPSNTTFFKEKATLHKRLSKDEQNVLFLRWRDFGDARAKDNLLFSCYGLNLREVAKKSYDHMLSQDDLLAVTILAQAHALRKFDPSANCAFSTYQLTWVRSYLLRELKTNRVISLPNQISLRDAPNRVSLSRCDSDGEFEMDFSKEDFDISYPMNHPVAGTGKTKWRRKAAPEQITQLTLF